MVEDIDDAVDSFRAVRDHDFNELRNDISGLLARVRTMQRAVHELSNLEDGIQEQEWAIIPQDEEERAKREDLLIDVHSLVDDGYLSSAWALHETFDYLKDEYAQESSEAESLFEKYREGSRAVMGLRTYSHHGNSLPISIVDDAMDKGVRRKIGILIDEVWSKKGEEYRKTPEYHYDQVDRDFFHLPVFLDDHYDTSERLVDAFVEEILTVNSDTVTEYQKLARQFRELLESGAQNRY